MNLSPSTGSEDLCFFAHMEKESGKAHQKGPTACLGALWDRGPTETIEQMPAGGVQSDDKVRKPTNLSQKETKSLWQQLKKCSCHLTKLTLKVPPKI